MQGKEARYSNETTDHRAEFTKRAVKHYRAVYPDHNILVIAKGKSALVDITDPVAQFPKILGDETFTVYAFQKGIFTKLPGENPGDYGYQGKYCEDEDTIHFYPCFDADAKTQDEKSSVKPGPGKDWVSVGLRGSNGKYVSNAGNGECISCDKDWMREWEQWILTFGPKGVSLRGHNNRYVCSQHGQEPMTCQSEDKGSCELFKVTYLDDTRITIRGNNGRYVSSEDGSGAMTCNRMEVVEWEIFTLVPYLE